MRLIVDSVAEAEGGGGTPIVRGRRSSARFLRIALERQEQSRWCWAAIAVSLATFYGTRSVSQRQLVAEILGGDAPGEDRDRNADARLIDALVAVGCYAHWSPGRPDPARLNSEIESGRPACLRIVWAGSGASHFVVIDGFAQGRDRPAEIEVADPSGARSLHRLGEFAKSYRGREAYCCETYWTGASAN